MAAVLLIGTDPALLEGLTQSLATAGHAVHVAQAMCDGVELAASRTPLVVIAERDMAQSDQSVLRLAAPGGALVVYHTAAKSAAALTSALQRAVMADLTLPLERHRLIALIQRVSDRVDASGRSAPDSKERRV